MQTKRKTVMSLPKKTAALSAVLAVLLLTAAPAAADAELEAFMQRKVIVDTRNATLCFEDTGRCHPVLVGVTTPKGRFDMRILSTPLPGYGGDVIGFKEERGFLFALHRVWTLKPAERRLQRLASPDPADRIMTNGCINVSDEVYEELKRYFVLEVV